MLRSRGVSLLVSAVVLAIGPASTGRAEFLSDLINNHSSITVGPLVFSNFSYTHTGSMPDASAVRINAITDMAGHPGFQVQGFFLDLFDVGRGSHQLASDAMICYTVTNKFGGPIMEGFAMSNPVVKGGNGSITVTESFGPEEPSSQIKLFASKPPSMSHLADSTVFSGVNDSIHGKIDINALSKGSVTVPNLSFVNTTFQSVPEPGSLLLCGVGSLGILGYYLRRRA